MARCSPNRSAFGATKRCWSRTSTSTACWATGGGSAAFVSAWALPPGERPFRRVSFALERSDPPKALKREIDAHPFVPRGQEQLRERCEEIFHTQVAGLAKRLDHIGRPPVTIGVSGGLDS